VRPAEELLAAVRRAARTADDVLISGNDVLAALEADLIELLLRPPAGHGAAAAAIWRKVYDDDGCWN